MSLSHPAELWIERPDGRLYYRRLGQGPPLFLLHAAPQAGWSYDPVLPGLAASFSCYVPDLPGFDHSDLPPRAYTIDDFTAAIVDLMDAVDVPRAHFTGSHTGAVVALNLAGLYPDRVARLVLEDSPGWTREEGQIIMERYFRPAYGVDGLPRAVPFEQAVQTNPALDRAKHERCNEVINRARAWIRVCQEANTSFDVPTAMRRVQAPTLVVFAEQDPLRRREQRFVELIPNATLRVLPGTSSEAHWDAPARFVEEVTAFLTR